MTNDHQKVATRAASDPELSRYHVLLDEEVLPRLERPGRYVGPLEAQGIAAHSAKNTPLALLWPSLPESHHLPRELAPWKTAVQVHLQLPVEFVCAPPADCEGVLAQYGLCLFTCPTWIPLSRFSLLVAWIEHPAQLLGLLGILKSAGIPLHTVDRAEEGPRVFAAGPGAVALASLLPAWVDEVHRDSSEESFTAFVKEGLAAPSPGAHRAAASPFLSPRSSGGEDSAPPEARTPGSSTQGGQERVRPALAAHLKLPLEEIEERFGGARRTRLRLWAGSERLRQSLDLASSDALVEALGRALAHESRLLEVDLAVGLPGETAADRAAIGLLARQLVAIAPRAERQLLFRVHAYVPEAGDGGLAPDAAATWLDAIRREFVARKLKISISSRSELAICRALGAAELKDAEAVEKIFEAGARNGDRDSALSLHLWESWIDSKGLPASVASEEVLGEEAASTGLEAMPPCPASLDENGHPVAPSGSPTPATGRKDRWHRWSALVPREYQLRVSYEKRDRIRHLSHKETMELFVEACRNGDVPLAVAGVVSPRPKLSFGPPLPAGIEGLDEFVDLSLTQKTAGIVQTLREYLPEGFHVRWARYLPPGDRKAHAPIQRARFRAQLRSQDAPRVRETVERFSKAQCWEIKRIKSETTSILDLKAQVTNVEFIEREDGSAELGFDLDLADATARARPYEVVAALSGADADDVRTIPLRRVSQWSRGGEPMGSWKTPLDLLDLSLRKSRQAVKRFA